MKFLYKLERKFGKYAIKNLSGIILGIMIFSYVLYGFFEDVYINLVFSPVHIFEYHQYWRIVTWIFTIPQQFNIFTFVMMFFYFSVGRSVERSIGTFRYNLYVIGTYLLITIVNIVTWVIIYNTSTTVEFVNKAFDDMSGVGMMTYYILISVFLGYALVYSDAMVLLYFIIPFKVSWLAYIDAAYLFYYFVKIPSITSRVTIICIGLSFGLFYLLLKVLDKGPYRRSATQSNFRRAYRSGGIKIKNKGEDTIVEFQTGKATPSNITRHKCAVCGKTERDGYDIEFRFCSKCNGNYEYCKEHLYTHEHVK